MSTTLLKAKLKNSPAVRYALILGIIIGVCGRVEAQLGAKWGQMVEQAGQPVETKTIKSHDKYRLYSVWKTENWRIEGYFDKDQVCQAIYYYNLKGAAFSAKQIEQLDKINVDADTSGWAAVPLNSDQWFHGGARQTEGFLVTAGRRYVPQENVSCSERGYLTDAGIKLAVLKSNPNEAGIPERDIPFLPSLSEMMQPPED
jgi:hypothetical protein